MLVKVWNDNVHPFKQKIAENMYSIPAKGYIEMDQDEADKLLKAFSPIEVDYDNRPLPTSYKMLRIDEDDLKKVRMRSEAKTKGGSYICQACGYVASNKWELDGHSLDMHQKDLDDVEEAMASIDLNNQEKRRAGRPKKNV